jgi:hypothetical protein
MDHTKLVVVQKYLIRPEADLAKCTLEGTGIQAMIQGDTAGGMREHLAWSGAGYRILVREEDATEAREVLNPLIDAADNPDPGPQTDPDTRPPLRRMSEF